MTPLSILVTASGSPGTAALVRSLRENGERDVRVVGVDLSERAIGRHLCDAFGLVPAGSDPAYADAVLDACRALGATVVLPQHSYDLPGLAAARGRLAAEGVTVLVGSPDAVHRANDNGAFFALLDQAGVPGPAWRRVRGGEGLVSAAADLGYPDVDVCMKPVVSSGSRGFRILSAGVDRRRQLLEERPGALPMRLEEAAELIGDDADAPELLVMELLVGTERTIDGFARDGEVALCHAKTREAVRAGLAMWFESLDEPLLEEHTRRIVRELALDHFFNVQLVGDAVIEINPRISTIVYQPDLNIPWLGVKHALGETTTDELAAARAKLQPGRVALRYYDQVEWPPT